MSGCRGFTIEEIRLHNPQTSITEHLNTRDRATTVFGIAFNESFGKFARVGHHAGDERAPGVSLDRIHVGRQIEICRFTPLSHHVRDVDLLTRILEHTPSNSVDEEAGNHAGEQAPGPKQKHIGLFDRLGDILGGLADARAHLKPFDREPRVRDLDLTSGLRTIRVGRDERDFFPCHREHPTPHMQEAIQLSNGDIETPRDASQGRDEEVAKAVSLEIGFFESIVEEPREDRFAVRKGEEAIPNVSGWDHVEFFAESTGGASVVGHSDDRGDRIDPFSQASEQARHAGATAEGDY